MFVVVVFFSRVLVCSCLATRELLRAPTPSDSSAACRAGRNELEHRGGFWVDTREEFWIDAFQIRGAVALNSSPSSILVLRGVEGRAARVWDLMLIFLEAIRLVAILFALLAW